MVKEERVLNHVPYPSQPVKKTRYTTMTPTSVSLRVDPTCTFQRTSAPVVTTTDDNPRGDLKTGLEESSGET